jgi:tyrosine-protein kinase Etk/Wzc
MNTQQAQLTTFSFPGKSSGTNKLGNSLTRYIYYWPLFVLVTLVFLALAFIYSKTIAPTFEARASLLIQDEKKTPDQKTALQELNLATSPKILENEMEILKSKELLSKVVDDLKLYVSYHSDFRKKGEDLYSTMPIEFVPVDSAIISTSSSLEIKIKDAKTFLYRPQDGNEKEYAFNTLIKNESGTWKLIAKPNILQFKEALITINVNSAEQTALNYQRSIAATLQNKLATAITLSLEDSNPQRGKDILNRLILNYNLLGKSQKDEETRNTMNFIDQRLASLTGELTEAEKGIEGFKSSRGITDISADSKISLENMQTNDSRLNEVNVQINVIEGVERYISANQNNSKVPAIVGIEDPSLNSLIEKLSQLQLQREKLLATTPETNPDFEPINRGIQSTKSAIRDNVNNIKSSLLSTRNQLRSYNSQFESSIKNIPTQERQYISIKRQQASKENLYTYLLQKKEEVSVSYATTLSNEHIIDHAYAVPAKNLKKLIAYAAAILLGIGLPLALLYLRNSIKNRIINVEDVKEILDVPVIGQLELSADKRSIVIDDKSPSAMSEQIRALRSNLYHLYKNNKLGRVTLVSSSISGEGKSFVSSNLAVALALSGRKTLIIEADMRKPKISAVFNLNKSIPGISELLMEKASIKDAVQQHQTVENLHIISSGALVNSPSELLEKDVIANLIETLRETYDDIIIDSPPVHLVSDGLRLAQLSDVTLYIIRQGYTDKAELGFIKELIDQEQITNMALVFNGISKVKFGFGYNYDYSYYNQESKKRPFDFLFSNFRNRFVLD